MSTRFHYVCFNGFEIGDRHGLEELQASVLLHRGKYLGRTLLSACLILHLTEQLCTDGAVCWKKVLKVVLNNYASFHNIKSTFNQDLGGIIQRIVVF